MDHHRTLTLPWQDVPTPCYLIHTGYLEDNLRILEEVQRRTGAKILLALKGFAAFRVFPQIRECLVGISASSLNEARLGRQEFGRELHVYSPAYRDGDFAELLQLADHLIFNSVNQWKRFRERCRQHGSRIEYGLRINPEYSEVAYPQYNPCSPYSRFGMTRAHVEREDLSGISGLHFHTLCEQQADTLDRTLQVVVEKFGDILKNMTWINLGGGHHITQPAYDIPRLCRCIDRLRSQFDLHVYLEPGEAVVLNAGFLVSSVLDTFNHGMDIAVLDTSATAHMPDVLEMPYRPNILGAGQPGEKAYTARLGGLTCLAGDVIGDYSFDRPLRIGDRLVFCDMAHYTMVKNTTFNGVPLPSIAVYDENNKAIKIVRQFGYEDYRNRLS